MDDLSYDEAMRIVELRMRHQTDQLVEHVKRFTASMGTVADMLAAGVAFIQGLDIGMRPLRSDVRLRAMLATREDFERQYAKQRANKRRRDRRR